MRCSLCLEKVLENYPCSGVRDGWLVRRVRLGPRRCAAQERLEDHGCEAPWVERVVQIDGAKSVTWRPRPIYRRHASKFIVMIDNVVRVSTHFAGLVAVLPVPGTTWEPANWMSWPLITLGTDQGSECVRASLPCYSSRSCGQTLSRCSNGHTEHTTICMGCSKTSACTTSP